MEAIAEAPSPMTQTASAIMEGHAAQPAFDAVSDTEAAFNKAFPNGVPAKGEESTPTATPTSKDVIRPEKTEPPPVDLDKPLIPEAALKPVRKEAAVAADVEKELAEQTKGMSETASAKFKKIHERATAAETRLKQMEADASKRTALPAAASDEFKQLQSEKEVLDEIVKKTVLERHPGFKAQYDGEIDKQVKLIKAIVGEKHSKEVLKIIDGGDDTKWDEIQESLGSLKTQQLAALGIKIQQTRLEKQEQLDNWKDNYAKLEKFALAEQSKAQEVQQRALDKAIGKVIADAQENVEIFRKVEGNDEWNNEIDARVGQIKQWATQELTPENRANLAVRAAGAEKYRALFLAVLDRANQLQAQVAKYKGAQPNIGGSGEPANQGGLPQELDYIEASTRRLTDMGELRTS